LQDSSDKPISELYASEIGVSLQLTNSVTLRPALAGLNFRNWSFTINIIFKKGHGMKKGIGKYVFAQVSGVVIGVVLVYSVILLIKKLTHHYYNSPIH